jgi:hypothetical protein
MQVEVIGLAEAAVRLRVPYQDAHRLLLTGRLRGEKRGGRWFVSTASLESLLRTSAGPNAPKVEQRASRVNAPKRRR